MASKHDTTSKGFNVTNDKDRTKTQLLHETVAKQEPGTRNVKKRSRSSTQTMDLQIEKRKRRELDFENEETVLRDSLLDEIDSRVATQISKNQTSIKETSMENSNGEIAAHVQNRKIIKLKGKLPNLALPEGWLALNHRSGGIIYLHRSSRVCTWSRPYYIGKGSVKKHDVPVAAIPCLHQMKALENESKLYKLGNDSSDELQASYSSVSALNFINTVGALTANDGQMQQHNSEREWAGGLSRSHVEKEICVDDIVVPGGDGNGNNSNNGDEGGVNSNVGNEEGNRKGDNCVSGESYGAFSGIINNDHYATKSEFGVFGIDNGISKRADTTEMDCGVLENNHKGFEEDGNDNDEYGGTINSCHDGATDDCTASSHQSLRHVKHDDDHDDVGIQNIIPDIFNPKDGLDVVNDTLSVPCPETISKSSYIKNDKPIESEVLLSSSNCETSNILTALGDTTKQNKCLLSKKKFRGSNIPTSNHISFNDRRVNEISDVDKVDINQTESFKSSKRNTITTQTSKPVCDVSSSKSGIELVDSEELTVYLEKLFHFEEISQEQEQNVTMTSLDQSSQQGESPLPNMLECLPYSVKGIDARQNKEWVLNPGGKTPIAILHEYSQAVLKEKPVYVCSECDNPCAPFMAEVHINGITHGTGVASTKKQAKQAAAEATLQVFLPEVFKKIRDYQISPEELQYYDKLMIDHPSVYEVSIKSGVPCPSQLLQECLKRNQGVCSSLINFKIIPGEKQNDHSYKISCGKHTAEGLCKNKKQGKQLASQALLKKLHPHVSTWGSLLRIYCDRPSSVVKKYKTTEDDILMSKPHCLAGDTPRGELVLARLKKEMEKIADDKIQPGQSRPRKKDYIKDSTICTVDV